MTSKSYTFTHAICLKPSPTIVDGLRAVDVGEPDLTLFEQHHTEYVKAVKSTGAHVTVLDPLPEFPDSVFVEDTALCLQEGAIILRPGAPTRRGESEAMRPHLENLYSNTAHITGDGVIEGGDILTTEAEILVGLSERTNVDGVVELQTIVAEWGYKVRIVDTPPGVLHFKTDCSLLDEETILTTKRLAVSGCFENYQTIFCADGEEAAANTIRFNDLVLMPAGFPKTRDRLADAGYTIREIGNSEAAKLDGGMSCLSLRFSPL